ncbi:MAG: CRISPR-associated protein Cas4 [Acidobacteriota bacterium]|nr:CRISPR-associated protein Cas4 [Acidobacteriota bacterium]
MKDFDSEELLPISGLQHLVFCPRQCALIHLERFWVENQLTAEGRDMHQRVHSQVVSKSKNVVSESGISLYSLRLGLQGKADIVDFVYETRRRRNLVKVVPVEYKRGLPKRGLEDRIQLCAQAICLEEMTGIGISEGSIYYGRTRRHIRVEFTEALRSETESVAKHFHTLIASGRIPPPVLIPGCRSCSFFDYCMPAKISKSAVRYMRSIVSNMAKSP